MAVSKSGKTFTKKYDFKEVASKSYYVDKTLLIKDLIDNESEDAAILITRPRRFGKSLNLSMIKTFFEKTGADTSVYFKDLDVWKCGEKYTSEQGRYPVICMDFKDVRCDTYEASLSKILSRLSYEFSRHKELMLDRTVYADSDLSVYDKIVKESADVGKMEDALLVLSRMLYVHHGIKPIVLIDEYDVPIQCGYEQGYYSDIIGFFRGFLSAALKGNDNLTFALITGATRIAKASIFTGLNNLGVYSVTSDRYSRYFGFTKEEIVKILDDFGHPEKMDEVCKWYDGYHFGNSDMFNPWSVSQYVSNDFKPAAYWLGTSENSIIKDLFKSSTETDVKTLRALFDGDPLTEDIMEDISYGDLYRTDEGKRSAIYSVMLATGYLTPQCDELGLRQYVIPNNEVKIIYRKEILIHLWGSEGQGSAMRIKAALAHRDAERLENAMQNALNDSVSYFDLVDENSYHNFVNGLNLALDDEYMVRSNEESGLGRFDISYQPRNLSGIYPGIIVEIKVAASEKDMDAEAEKALAQIEDKAYDAKLRDAGVEKIDKYAMVFCGKKVKVVKKDGD